jgi:hypothetical protein
MAGSYNHRVTDSGQLSNNENFVDMIGDLGDACEAVEEMYGMIWYLAQGNAELVEVARRNYQMGIADSPGTEE